MTNRIYVRRSKNDEGKQPFSLDVQRAGSREYLAARLGLNDEPVEYLDDGRSGDDFTTRTGFLKLLRDAAPGDVVVCRDQSRLGRDALEVTLAVREIVRDRGCRLYYYTTGGPVPFANAIDQATTFIQGTGNQLELEAIRSRTTEALRSRAALGRIAGGKCYGYKLHRETDGAGRSYTLATIDEEQAPIVRRIFALRCEGRGLKQIAWQLNAEGIPAPIAGRRSTGSWSPTCIRWMLASPRYRGIYVHGRIKKQRRNGVVQRVRADPSDVITTEIPEWRIVDDGLWLKAQESFPDHRRVTAPRTKFPLTGIARCASCGGAIGSGSTRRSGVRIAAYTCIRHHTRGPAVCPVSVYQPMDEVERALVDHIQRAVLVPEVVDAVLAEIRGEIEAQIPAREVEVSDLEADLRQAKAEQRRYTEAVRLSDDVPELMRELQKCVARVRGLETRIAAARRAPDEVLRTIDQAEVAIRARFANIQTALADPDDRRAAFLRLFPEGLSLEPSEVGPRKIWRMKGGIDLGSLALAEAPGWFNLEQDPAGA